VAPIYAQIANQIKSMIWFGTLRKGQPLPGRQALASQLGVNINTIDHAYRILENEGYLYGRRGIGGFVNVDAARGTRSEFVDEIHRQLRDVKGRAMTHGPARRGFQKSS
jgi:DNA-binding transcriptional regulator YhcF (GntR family)